MTLKAASMVLLEIVLSVDPTYRRPNRPTGLISNGKVIIGMTVSLARQQSLVHTIK